MSKHHTMSSTQRRGRMRQLFDIQGGRCAFCDKVMIHPDVAREERPFGCTTPRPDDPTLEHVAAKSQMGSDVITNLLLAHFRCNKARGNGPLPESARIMWKANRIALEVMHGQRPAPVACGACEMPHRCEAVQRCRYLEAQAA